MQANPNGGRTSRVAYRPLFVVDYVYLNSLALVFVIPMMTTEEDLGFEHYNALQILKKSLVEAGGITQQHEFTLGLHELLEFLAAASGVERPRELVLGELGGLLRCAAFDHIVQHGVEMGGPKCRESPCKAASICSVIWDVTTYLRERTYADILRHAEKVRAGLAGMHSHVVRIAELGQTLKEPKHLQPELPRTGDWAARLDASFATTIDAYDGLRGSLSPAVTSPQHALSARNRTLRDSMYGDLYRGGFSYREIVRMGLDGRPIPPPGSDAEEDARQAVKQCIRRDEGRRSLNLRTATSPEA